MQTKIKYLLIVLFLLNSAPYFSFGLAEETPTMAIEKAKFAVEQAQKAGAFKAAPEDLATAEAWLASAQKEYEKSKSAGAWMTSEKTRRIKEAEIIYLATMAKIKAMIAENRVKKEAASKKLTAYHKELKIYQNKLDFLKKQLAEAEIIKKFQAQIEAKEKESEETKRQIWKMEQEKKLIMAEALRKVREIELNRQKELSEIRIKETQRAAEIEKELAEARLKLEELAKEKTKEETEKKSISEKLSLLQEKTASLERKIDIIIAASKISGTTSKITEKEIIINILANHLFTPKLELSDQGKETLDHIGKLLNNYPGYQVIVRGHTDSIGNPTVNQELSEKRAQKVREYLVAYQNIFANRIIAEGWGPSRPVAPNDSEAGRMLNRRVEIVLIMEE